MQKKSLFFAYILLMPWAILLLYELYSLFVARYPIDISLNYEHNAMTLFFAHMVFLFLTGILLSGVIFFPNRLLKEKILIGICTAYTILPLIISSFFYQFASGGLGPFLYRTLYYVPLISGVYFVALLVGINMRRKESR